MAERPARPKLLYLVTEDWYFVSHRLALALAAKDKGYDVSVATRVSRHGDQIRNAGLDLIAMDFSRAGLHPIKEARFVSQLVGVYRRARPDIVHHVAMKPVIYGSLAARLAGVRGVVNALMGLGFVFSSESAKARVLRPGVRYALKSALSPKGRRLILQNRDDVDMFKRQGLAPPQSIRLIRGSGVDPARYSTVPPPEGLPIVALPARLLRDKGVHEFVECARMLKADGIAARFVLVGEPDPQNPASFTAREIVRWREQGIIEHWGWHDDMAAVFAQASVVCLPSYREGLPKALLEAAASARAIVTCDVPGCREIVVEGQNGWLVPPRDSQALAAALREALANPTLCATFGARGRDMVEQNFASDIIIRQTLDVYAELFAPPP